MVAILSKSKEEQKKDLEEVMVQKHEISLFKTVKEMTSKPYHCLTGGSGQFLLLRAMTTAQKQNELPVNRQLGFEVPIQLDNNKESSILEH